MRKTDKTEVKNKTPRPDATFGEELTNALTHGLGAIFGVVALTLLVVFAVFFGDAWHVVSFAIYGGTLVLMYTMSTLYHSFKGKRVKLVFRVLDHSAIYLLIAGTYTPLTLVTLRGYNPKLGWIMFGVIWGLSVAGISTAAISLKGKKWLNTLLYLCMGWAAIFVMGPLVEALPVQAIALLIAGGACFTAGAAFYLLKIMPYHHSVWHLFIIGGTVCHFIMIFAYVLPLTS